MYWTITLTIVIAGLLVMMTATWFMQKWKGMGWKSSMSVLFAALGLWASLSAGALLPQQWKEHQVLHEPVSVAMVKEEWVKDKVIHYIKTGLDIPCPKEMSSFKQDFLGMTMKDFLERRSAGFKACLSDQHEQQEKKLLEEFLGKDAPPRLMVKSTVEDSSIPLTQTEEQELRQWVAVLEE